MVGVFVGGAVDVLANLLAAAIQSRAFADQFTASSTLVLAGLMVGGLLAGYWLGCEVPVPPAALARWGDAGTPQTVTITRLRALLSYARLRGKGIHLSEVLVLGSRVEIDTRE